MTEAEERMRILEMVQNGRITAEEASLLLKSLDRSRAKPAAEASPGVSAKEPRDVRIRVIDLNTGKEKVNVKMAWNLLSVGVRMGAQFAHDDIRMEDLMEAVQAGVTGKVLDMVDKEDQERVEIFIE